MAAFVGFAQRGLFDERGYLAHAVHGFFAKGGTRRTSDGSGRTVPGVAAGAGSWPRAHRQACWAATGWPLEPGEATTELTVEIQQPAPSDEGVPHPWRITAPAGPPPT